MRPLTIAVTAATGLLLIVVLLAAAAAAGLQTLGGLIPTSTAITEIPAGYLTLYQRAALTCPGLPWTVLAGIGRVETDHGRDTHTSSAGAVGPMQFLPATFTEYDRPVPPGGARPPSPHDPTDAIYAAARLLCANGARGGANIPAAIYAYNHADWYVTKVLAIAASYGTSDTTTNPAAAAAIAFALNQLGTPYRWGGETPGVGFDCSGLTQAAYAAANITIPRTSESQWQALPHVPTNTLQPGDLVFFNPGEFFPGLPGHVGIYLGNGEYVDAPHTGADVRTDQLASSPPLFGAARPTASTPTERSTP